MKNQADADSPGAGESMQSKTERDYILGTNDEEVIRLGSQHRVWRPVVSKLWWKAGITVRKRVLDLGAGPGYAAIDLAEIVGSAGEIVAVELRQSGGTAHKCASVRRSPGPTWPYGTGAGTPRGPIRYRDRQC